MAKVKVTWNRIATTKELRDDGRMHGCIKRYIGGRDSWVVIGETLTVTRGGICTKAGKRDIDKTNATIA